MADETLKSEERERIESEIQKIFAREGIPYSLTYIKAFYEGGLLMAMARAEGQNFEAIVIMMLRSIISRKETELKDKVDASMNVSNLN